MKIHEYQAKELFKKYDIPIPEGSIAFSCDEAKAAAEKLGQFPVVIKAQIHAGGRGKGVLFKKGKVVRKIPEYELAEVLIHEVMDLVK